MYDFIIFLITDDLTVSLSSSPLSPVTDTAVGQEQVTLTCAINLPADDVTVKITKTPSDTALPHTVSNGMYSVTLRNVHPGDSGTYRCEVNRTIDGTETTKSDDLTLTVGKYKI